MYKCEKCLLVYADKIPSKDEINNYYNSGLYYQNSTNPNDLGYLKFSEKISKSRLKLLCKNIDFESISRVLDVGAGNAQFGVVLKKINSKIIYDIVEPDPLIGEKVKEKAENCYQNIGQLEYNEYDLIIINQVLEHVVDPVEFLISLTKPLKSRGYIFIDVPNSDYKFKNDFSPHILFWNIASLKRLIQLCKLQLLFIDSVGMDIRKAKKLNNASLWEKLFNRWFIIGKLNFIFNKFGINFKYDTFKKFESNNYGGNRIWIRCIMQK